MSYGFLHGTKVETGLGALAIERMRPGDRVLTLAGKLERITWVAHMTLSAREAALAPDLRPVRLHREARLSLSPLGDLVTAPEQGVLMCSGVGQAEARVKSAKALPDGARRLPVLYDLQFVHLMLETDSLMLVNGIWCQSMAANPATDTFGFETRHVKTRLVG